MKKRSYVILVPFLAALTAGLLAALAGCASSATVVNANTPSIQAAQEAPYDGPQKRISVKAFKNKTAKGSLEIGQGMSDMLSSALFESGRFIVLERENIKEVMDEQDFGASGRVKKETAPAIGEIEGAELLIYGSITEFEPDENAFGGVVAIPGIDTGVTAGVKTAHMALDIRIVDAKTSRLVATATVVGKANSVGGGVATAINVGGEKLPVGLGGFQKTPMEQAIRKCVNEAVRYISAKAPK